MTRWDEQEKTKSSNVSTLLLGILFIFCAGFLVGGLWGYFFFEAIESTPIPPAFGETLNHYTITLYDSITISDEAFIRP